MPIRKHGNGWEVRIQHGGRRLSKTVATRSDAQHLEAVWRQRLNDTKAGRAPSYGLEEALHRWLTGEALALKSYEDLKSKVALMYDACKGRHLDEIVAAADQVKADGLKAGLLPATINRRLAILKRVAKLAYKRWEWLENDLGAKIQLLPGERKRSEYVTVEQGKRLMAASSGKMRELIRWACLTGLRRGELLSLEPSSFRGREIILHDWQTKSGKARVVPLPPELDPKRFPFGMNYNTFDKHWKQARRRARIAHIRFHDLRRSYGTWLHQQGADLAAIRDLYGHSTIAQTSTYLGVSSTDLKRAVSRLPGLTRGKKAVSHR
jgi:integrase